MTKQGKTRSQRRSLSAPPSVVEQEPQLYEIVAEHFDGRSDWSIAFTPAWMIVTYKQTTLPGQGWKVHISAGLCSVEEVLRRVLPVLCEQKVCFKVAATLKKVRDLNHGFAGASQVGKCITVYPTDQKQAVSLSLTLDELTRGLRGPTVPSDRLLHAESLISYRYGSFMSKLMYTEAGKVVPAITTPSGQLSADVRDGGYQTPDWLQDPFVAAGVVVAQAPTANILVGGRYLPLFTPYLSARGGVSLGVDTFRGRSCMLKFARPNAYLDKDGTDARDILRYEAAMLQRLAGDPAFPAFFDLLEHEGTLYMVMEEVQGETLGACAERLFARGELCVDKVIAWTRVLAGILGDLHARGLIYRDLKPANVLVGSRLRLIDFELMVEEGSAHAKSDIGTRGFMSPQHRVGAAASVADDVYSLGALLYYLLSRANPSLAPDPGNLLQRPLDILNPDLDQGLVRIVEKCLEYDPQQRFTSMIALQEALGDPAPYAANTMRQQEFVATPHHYLRLAARLGDTLCQNAVHQPERVGVCWLSTVQFADGRALRALNCGSGGTLLALAELVGALGIEAHRRVLQEGAQWLLHSEDLIANPVPGLYVGEAGVGAALLRAGQVLDDVALIEAAAEKSRWVARQAYTCQDIMSGAAGRLRFHLLVWEETREQEHLQAARVAGDWLLSEAEDIGGGMVCWRLPAEFTGMTYVGYAHGAAGIADALLDLYEASGDERFIAPVAGVARLLQQLAVPVQRDGSAVNWPLYVADKKREMAGVYWCHGAAGIGTFLLHAAQHGLVARDLVVRAARTVAFGSRWSGPTLCHGLAGNSDFLLDMFEWTGERKYASEAFTLADILETFAIEQEGQLVWPSDEPTCISPDYLVGYAGVLVSLLRLAQPGQRPRQLCRRGFRYAPGTNASCYGMGAG